MADVPPCPECAQGKHQNCTEQVLTEADDWEWCPCSAVSHQPSIDDEEHP